MIIPVPKKLEKLSDIINKPLYIVGGYVRNYLINQTVSNDVDLSSPVKCEELLPYLVKVGLKADAVYKNTGTVLISDGKVKYEFTTFRTDSYKVGHRPSEIKYTESITEDCLRRDFTCNAVYYDIKNRETVDLVGGIRDIKNKIIKTVRKPDEVFKEDGLRLMRLARFYAELGFRIESRTLTGAKNNSEKITEISSERIYTELKYILKADKKYPFSPKNAHVLGIEMLDKTGVLEKILPELTLCKNTEHNKSSRKYSVFSHSLKCMEFTKGDRLSALLHDVGKPYCFNNGKDYSLHGIEGEKIVRKILERLKISNAEKEKICFLTKHHTIGEREDLTENDITLFLIKNYKYAQELCRLIRADLKAEFNGGKISDGFLRCERILKSVKGKNIPKSQRDLDICGNDLLAFGINGKKIGETLLELLDICILSPELNNKKDLLILAENIIKSSEKQSKRLTKN